MKWSVATALGIGLLMIPTIAKAQPSVEPSLILSTDCGQFHVVLGRLHLDASFYKKVRLHQSSQDAGGGEDYLCVSASGGVPSLHYQSTRSDCQVTIDTLTVDAVRIEKLRRSDSGPDESLLIEQPSQGPIQVTHRIGSNHREFTSVSFWHLLAESPVLFEHEVLPLLSLMIRRDHWQRAAEEIQHHLQQRAASAPHVTRQQIHLWVKQLGSSKRSTRQAARKRLVSVGVGALPILASIDPLTLDAEQKMRIGQIEKHLRSGRHDTPDRVAAWLATDYHYWSVASRQWPAHKRRDASHYMVLVCGNPLDRSTDRIARHDSPTTR